MPDPSDGVPQRKTAGKTGYKLAAGVKCERTVIFQGKDYSNFPKSVTIVTFTLFLSAWAKKLAAEDIEPDYFITEILQINNISPVNW